MRWIITTVASVAAVVMAARRSSREVRVLQGLVIDLHQRVDRIEAALEDSDIAFQEIYWRLLQHSEPPVDC